MSPMAAAAHRRELALLVARLGEDARVCDRRQALALLEVVDIATTWTVLVCLLEIERRLDEMLAATDR